MPQQEKDDRVSVIRLETLGSVEEHLASTPRTRRIANDPLFLGVDYTSALRQSCADVLRADAFGLVECETHVLNILRGGLNFGLREALHLAFGWNRHATDFLSAQRTNGADGWRIDESGYRKLSFAGDVSLVLGDVEQLLEERFLGLDPRRFGSVDLVELCEHRLAAIAKTVTR